MAYKDNTVTPHGYSYPESTADSISETDSCISTDSGSCNSTNAADHAYQLRRLAPARAIAASGIASIVWGRDALEFAHRIPATYIDCHLLVDDGLLSQAAMLLVRSLGYIHASPDPRWLEHPFPDSVRLKHSFAINANVDEVPRWVLLTPMSYYHVQTTWCSDPSRTFALPLPVENGALRFPTLFAYLDALVATYLEPRYGWDWALVGSLSVDIEELLECGVPKKDRSGIGRISEAGEAVLGGVRRENRLFLKRTLVRCREGSWLEWQKERRMVLSGQYEVRGCSCGRCTETETAF